jgi:predicted TIM-barrel fold metal-dependent hydrolase
MWRLDAEWKALRTEVPWVTRRPSDYLRDHVRFSTQPLERPEDDRDCLQMLVLMDAEHLLMFSSDYPHWDFDDPFVSLPPSLTDAQRQAVYAGNARALYRLD